MQDIDNRGNWGRLEGHKGTLDFLLNLFCNIRTALPPKWCLSENIKGEPQEVKGHKPGVYEGHCFV